MEPKLLLARIMSARGGPETAVILLDQTGCIVDAHASCLETFGWSREELVGKDVREMLQYGRDLLMSQLHLLEENDSAGNTSFTIRVLARRKDQQQFPARATVRRFRELECWTVAFYQAESDAADSNFSPAVSPQEIALAKRALEENALSTARDAAAQKNLKDDSKKGEAMSVSRLWRNSRLLFSSREDKSAEPDLAAAPVPDEHEIAAEATALAAECLATPGAPSPASAREPVETAPAPPPSPLAEPVISEAPAAPRFQTAPEIKPEPRSHASRSDAPSYPSENAAFARLKAEFEKERGERTRTEQRAASLSSQVQALHLQLSESLNFERDNQSRVSLLEQELHSTLDSFANYKVDFENLRREQQSTEDQLVIVRELNTRLQENLAHFEKARKTLEAAQSETRLQLEQHQIAVHDAEILLDKEREARRQLEQTLATTLREHRSVSQKSSLELAELRASFELAQLDRSRSQEEALRSRAESLEAVNSTHASVARFRGSFSRVLEHINGTTRELLQSPLTEEQKCVIETLLQDVISLESTLENGTHPSGSH